MRGLAIGPLAGAGVFGLLSLWALFGSVRNFAAYAEMRTLPVEVLNSSLLIDAGADQDLDFVLRLDLRATDASRRVLHWEEDLTKAAYPEEAYDVLTEWTKGTRHTIYALRGQAREIRLEAGGKNPELNAGIGLMILAGFLAVFTVSFLIVAYDTNPWVKRTGMRSFVGPWMIFFAFGLGPLIGSFLFLRYNIPKRTTWPTITAAMVKERPPAPANVQVTPAAQAEIAKMTYELISFSWNGKLVYGGMGSSNGVYDKMKFYCGNPDPICHFKINPKDRWDMELKAEWDEDLYGPAGVLLFFGIAFCGAGLFIRKVDR